MNLRFVLAIAAAALLSGSALATSPETEDAPIAYRVRPGDTLFGLGQRYLRSPGDYAVVQRLNKIANPRRMRPGSTLSIPYRLLRTEPVTARLAAFRGDVEILSAGARLTPQRGMVIPEGAELATGANAFLTIQLEDGSRTTLPSQSRLKVIRLRRILLTDQIDRILTLDEGRSSSKVQPAARATDRFMITTPLAVSAVRGTEFRVAHSTESGRSALEVVEGQVGNRPAAALEEVLAPAGVGVVTSPQGASAAIALLPAPKLSRPGQVQEDPVLRFELETTPRAQSYRAQLAYDAGFIDLFAETMSPAPELTFAPIPDGTYFVRFTAIDENGLEGMPAQYAFERRLNTIDVFPPTALDSSGRRYLFRWEATGGGTERFRFQLSRNREATDVVIDLPGLGHKEVVVTDLPPGAYYWRVLVSRAQDGKLSEKWSPTQQFDLGG